MKNQQAISVTTTVFTATSFMLAWGQNSLKFVQTRNLWYVAIPEPTWRWEHPWWGFPHFSTCHPRWRRAPVPPRRSKSWSVDLNSAIPWQVQRTWWHPSVQISPTQGQLSWAPWFPLKIKFSFMFTSSVFFSRLGDIYRLGMGCGFSYIIYNIYMHLTLLNVSCVWFS